MGGMYCTLYMKIFLGCQNTLIAYIEFFYCQYCSSITPMLSLFNLSDLCINHWKTLQSQNGKISIFFWPGNTVPTVTVAVAVSGLNIHPIRNRIIPSPAPGWVTPPTCRQKMVEGGNGYLILRSCKQNHAFKLTAVCGACTPRQYLATEAR